MPHVRGLEDDVIKTLILFKAIYRLNDSKLQCHFWQKKIPWNLKEPQIAKTIMEKEQWSSCIS
jgi:hypothetical protein